MSDSDSPSGSSTVVNTSEPSALHQEFLRPGMEAALQEGLNSPQSYFPNSTVVPFSNQSEAALGGIEQRALAGNPLDAAAQQQTMSNIQGDYVNQGNPNLGGVMDRIQNTVRPGIDSQFANSGRYGSGAHQESMTRAFADAAAPYAFQNYENERGRQEASTAMAPAMAQTDYNDLDRMAGVGAQRENLAGQQVQDQINRFNFGQQEPQSRISSYLGNINAANLGSNSTATTPTFNNRGAGIAGGALVGSQLTDNPLLGGLLGAGAGFFL
tara:strand:- start:4499 stop:5305 length:807 start_codon:yes stop_codon:yes gene_type:complete